MRRLIKNDHKLVLALKSYTTAVGSSNIMHSHRFTVLDVDTDSELMACDNHSHSPL